MHPKRISILGVGLLGGSLGLAAKSAAGDCEIVGWGHRQSSLDSALEMGAIDRAADLAGAVCGAEVVVLCTPVGLFAKLMREIAPLIAPRTIVTDVGSTKRSVVRLGEELLGSEVAFVGSHPMAGSDKRGVEYARADLFQNAVCITTPTARTSPEALAKVEAMWKLVGMRVTRLGPEDHDRLLADISHLPHAVAAALVAMQEEQALGLCGKGFLDTTRIAGGDGALWRDIFLDNRDNVRDSIRRLRGRLDELDSLLDEGKGAELAAWLDAIACRRAELHQRKLRELEE